MSLPTSSAWLGPDRTATSALGTSCLIISVSVIRVSSSIPFATFTIICPSLIKPFNFADVLLTNDEATAITIISSSSVASFKLFVILIFSSITIPGRLIVFSLFSFNISTSLSTAD